MTRSIYVLCNTGWTEYLTNDSLASGDYGGAGAVGVANQRAIDAIAAECGATTERRHMGYGTKVEYGKRPDGSDWRTEYQNEGPDPMDVLATYGAYDSADRWIRADAPAPLLAAINGINDYPLIDEDIHSEVECEWERQAWQDWIRDELLRHLTDEQREYIDYHPDEYPDTRLWDAYRTAMEECNEYPETEYNSVSVDVERIQSAFVAALELPDLTPDDDTNDADVCGLDPEVK